MPTLTANQYGKQRVRLVKVFRDAGPAIDAHPSTLDDVREWNLGIVFTGDFDACFTAGDNTGLMATDTMKNAVYAVAGASVARTLEAFALELAAFLLDRNPKAHSLRITVEEKPWIRLKVSAAGHVVHGPRAYAQGHPSAFLQRGPELHTCAVTLDKHSPPALVAGVRGLVLLKTAHSAFHGFHRDALTTLPDSMDRLLGTEATLDWTFATPPADFAASRTRMMDALLTAFAAHESLSVQHTLYAMAEAGLAALPEVAEMTLTMPNRHNIPVDLTRFGQPNRNQIFIPQDEPHGLITARVVR